MADSGAQRNSLIPWLLAGEPWTRFCTLTDLCDLPGEDPQVQAARVELLANPQVQGLITAAQAWGERPLKAHTDATHPLYAMSSLADFGLQATDHAALEDVSARLLSRQSAEGAFQTLVNIPKHFGGSGEGMWTWIICDAPTLVYVLVAYGLGEQPAVQRAVEHLAGLVDDNGWGCIASPDLGKFKGPGRRGDPCPAANLLALKALALMPALHDSPAVKTGAEMLLSHWATPGQKYYMFGAGRKYRKLKFPLIWYNVLHTADVLSRFPALHAEPRFLDMLNAIREQADEEGRFTAGSIYNSWKGWGFSNKKQASAWLTFLVARIEKRVFG